jgi:protein-disulfide isomerase
LRKVATLIVTSIIGAATLAFASTPARSQDNWVQVPSSSDSSDSSSGTSTTTNSSTSQDNSTAGAHPQRGADNAAVTIIEYSDFQCPFCRRAEGSVRQVLKKYDGQVRLVYMDFPLPSHRYAMEAAIAARCADEQGRFWSYHDALFENPTDLTTSGLKSTAEQLGLDNLTFDRCLEQRKFQNVVLADQKEGETAGLRGIPYFIVDGHPMHGANTPAAFSTIIDQELKRR